MRRFFHGASDNGGQGDAVALVYLPVLACQGRGIGVQCARSGVSPRHFTLHLL